MVRFGVFLLLWLLPVSVFAQGWSEGRPMDTARAALAVARMGDQIYAVGGAGRLAPMSAAERYNPAGGSWRNIADLPVGLEQFGLAGLDGVLYAAGGYAADGNGNPGREMWKYDEISGEWRPAPALPTRRAAFALVAGAGKLYAIGGSGQAVNQMAVFDPKQNEWEMQDGGPQARRGTVALNINDKIYVIAGGPSSRPTGRVDIYDITSKSWSQGAELPIARSGHAAAVFGGKIHIMGGRGGGRGQTLKDHWTYDPIADEWTQGPSLSSPRTGAGAAAIGGSLYVIGGGSGGGFYASFTSMNSVEVLRNLPDF
ncbi:hypothetical protein MNBD_ALPHA06-854 [hydrothermal vent metagenome]|uniref:Galactose oxidase n=1 Tax=hydrothermal vent metagenome TaxID=652676 RepID=A0A3B0R8X5_9ZZZZ